jgi:hypothetical protein
VFAFKQRVFAFKQRVFAFKQRVFDVKHYSAWVNKKPALKLRQAHIKH